jgi:cell division protein FtsB
MANRLCEKLANSAMEKIMQGRKKKANAAGFVGLNILGAILIGVLILLQYRLWFESGGIKDMIKLKKELGQQAIENDKLKKNNEELLFQVQRIENSKDAAESRARNELGMIKKDETFYQIVKDNKDKNENTH